MLVEKSEYNLSILTTDSSKEVLPARSPIPLTVVWISQAPPFKADNVLATARPKSLWQWQEIGALISLKLLKSSNEESGVNIPTVSHTQTLSAPWSIAFKKTFLKKSTSLRDASSADNSTTRPWSLQ